MATLLITKQFVVKDVEAFGKLMAEIEKQSEREAITGDSRSLEEGVKH